MCQKPHKGHTVAGAPDEALLQFVAGVHELGHPLAVRPLHVIGFPFLPSLPPLCSQIISFPLSDSSPGLLFALLRHPTVPSIPSEEVDQLVSQIARSEHFHVVPCG